MTSPPPPANLLTVAHGTRTPAGNRVAREITRAAGERLDGPATCSFVELAEPLLADLVPSVPPDTVVVPLLLSTGFHLRQDLPAMVATASPPLRLGRSLGPHRYLAAAQVDRLVEAGAVPGRPLVLVAAGSTDPLATRDLWRAAELLGRAWGGPVRLGTLTGLGERVADVVRPGDVVSPYLLATGFFARRLREEALAAGAAVVADVIGPHPVVVDLVVARAQALRAFRRSPAARPTRQPVEQPRESAEPEDPAGGAGGDGAHQDPV